MEQAVQKTPHNKRARDEALISWSVQEEHSGEKSTDWFWALGILAISAASAAFILRNVLFGILILIASFLLALYVIKKPQTIRYALTKRGIRINEELYPYQTLESYWIHLDAHNPEDNPLLLVKSKEFFAPLLSIPLAEEVRPEDVADILNDLLELEEHDPPMAHRLLELFGF